MNMIKQSHKKTVRDPILKNLAGLEETINKIWAKNVKKMDTIRKNHDGFDFKLFNPSIPQYTSREQIGFAQQIMLRQIDKLMEDEEKLNIELNKLDVKKLEYEQKKQIQTQNNMDHFTFLRQYWQKQQKLSTAVDHLQKLIHNVGSIKGHIKSMVIKENEASCHPQLHQLIVQSPEYKILSKKYIDLVEKYDKKCSEIDKHKLTDLEKSLKQSEKRISQLQREKNKLEQQFQRTQNQNRTKNGIKNHSQSQQGQNQCSIIINSATDDYRIQIRSKQFKQNREIYSSLGKDQIISYFENSGRRGKAKNSDQNERGKNGNSNASINYSVADISKAKFIKKQIL